MPIVALPDGTEVEFPDGTPTETMEKAMREHVASTAKPAAPENSAARMAGNFGAGANERIAGVVGAPFDLLNKGLRAVGVPIPEGSVSGSILGGINSLVGAPPTADTTAEKFARGAGAGLVDAATVLTPAAIVSRTAQAGGLAQQVATAASAAPGMQIASGMAGGAVGEATDNPLLGAAAALAVPLGAAGLARAITPVQNALSPSRQAMVDAAQREGIPLSTGQVTGSKTLQNMEAAMAQLPGSSRGEAAFGEAQRRAFTQAALRRAGENADNAGPEVLNAARGRIGGTIGEIAGRNSLRVDDDLMGRLAQMETEISRYAVPEVAGPVRQRMQQLVAQVGEDGTVPGTFYRQMDSALGKTMRGTSNGDLRTSVGDLRDTLRQAMDSSIGPNDAAAWQQARREYANYKVIERVMGGAGGAVAEGNISPQALRGAVGGERYATGNADLGELARMGQGVLRAPPDSGTAGRSMMNALLTGSGPSAGAGVGAMIGGPLGAAVGAGAGFALPAATRAVYTNPIMQAYLRNQALSPETMQAIRGLRNNVLMQQTNRAVTD